MKEKKGFLVQLVIPSLDWWNIFYTNHLKKTKSTTRRKRAGYLESLGSGEEIRKVKVLDVIASDDVGIYSSYKFCPSLKKHLLIFRPFRPKDIFGSWSMRDALTKQLLQVAYLFKKSMTSHKTSMHQKSTG